MTTLIKYLFINHVAGNKNSEYENRVEIDSSMHTYGYSSRNHQMTGGNYGRSSADVHRVHPEQTATRQTPGHHHPSYSFNMTGWQSAANSRQTSYNLRHPSDVINNTSNTSMF